ncbi:MAG: tetratricopeptide repeat protein [Caldisericia bacterium]|nr:tetratricopeptide repeat protein [Caldisericia bacterium]
MDEFARQIGRAEAQYNCGKDNLEFGIELARLYSQSPNLEKEYQELVSTLVDKHGSSFSLQELIYQVAIARNDKALAETTAQRAIEIEPKNIDELRRKLMIYRDLNKKDESIDEVLKFESKNGRSPDTCWFLIDSYLSIEKRDEALKVKTDLEAMPDSYLRSVVLASSTISLAKGDVHDDWEKTQDLLLGAIKSEPKNPLGYKVLILSSKNLIPNRKTLDTIQKLAIDNGISDMFILLNLLGIYIEYSIMLRDEKLFDTLELILPDYEKPILSLLRVLTVYFDNYGLARSIISAWFDQNEALKPEFPIFISNVAISLATDAKKGIGLKAPAVGDGNDKRMNNDELALFLQKTAVRALERYLVSTPNNSDAYYRLGVLYKSMNDERAFAAFEKSLELMPDNINAMYQIAVINDQTDNDIEAYEMFRKIASSRSTEMSMMIDAMVRASEIAIKYGWIDEGEEFLEHANALMPTNPQVVTLLGKVFLKEAKIIGSDFALVKAQENFIKALALDRMNMDAAYYLGQVFYMKREYLAAIRQFNEAGNLFKQCSMLCNFWVARSYHQLYKQLLFSSKDFLKSAIKHAEGLRVISEKIPETLEFLAELYYEAGMGDEADKLMDKAKKAKRNSKFKSIGGEIGEVKVLAVYAPQVARIDDPNRVERVFSKGSIGKIEVSYIPGNGGLLITGNMGESFQNAIEVAYAFFKRYLHSKNRMQDSDYDIHVDVPGWMPKFDGPSAGVNLACAMISAYSHKPIPGNVTMTGEISFHGNVMPVGGIKEKIEATFEKGVDKIFIPRENKWDYLDMLIKDTKQEQLGDIENTQSKIPVVVAVQKIEEVIDDLGIGVEPLPEEQQEK